MDAMTLNLNKGSLLELMENFHLLTNIKIALFDANGNEILSYPENHCSFCALLRGSEEGKHNCELSNQKSFQRCQKTKQLEIFHCHAGLIETTVPLIDNSTVIGYIMFGQITDICSQEQVIALLKGVLHVYKLDKTAVDTHIYEITAKTGEQIQAAAKILEACTFYVLLKDMVSLQRKTFIQNLNSFLLAHLSEDLSVSRLTSEFHVSKNKLYDSCNRYLSVGIAEHIKTLRIEEAKRLLKETRLPIYEISGAVGFDDYNYFCRVFKSKVGIPAKKYRFANS